MLPRVQNERPAVISAPLPRIEPCRNPGGGARVACPLPATSTDHTARPGLTTGRLPGPGTTYVPVSNVFIGDHALRGEPWAGPGRAISGLAVSSLLCRLHRALSAEMLYLDTDLDTLTHRRARCDGRRPTVRLCGDGATARRRRLAEGARRRERPGEGAACPPIPPEMPLAEPAPLRNSAPVAVGAVTKWGRRAACGDTGTRPRPASRCPRPLIGGHRLTTPTHRSAGSAGAGSGGQSTHARVEKRSTARVITRLHPAPHDRKRRHP